MGGRAHLRLALPQPMFRQELRDPRQQRRRLSPARHDLATDLTPRIRLTVFDSFWDGLKVGERATERAMIRS